MSYDNDIMASECNINATIRAALLVKSASTCVNAKSWLLLKLAIKDTEGELASLKKWITEKEPK